MPSNTFCPLPWNHLATHPQGHITLCCEAEQNIRNVNEMTSYNFNDIQNHDTFKEARRQMLNGERPEVCKRCWKSEDAGNESKRLYEKNRLNFTEQDALNITSDSGAINNVQYEFIELRLGNHCNQACRTCNPISSTKWLKDWLPSGGDESYILPQKVFDWPLDTNFWVSLKEHTDKLKYLYINGGEPFLIDKHLDFLNNLENPEDITLVYSTNASIQNHLYEGVWRRFKRVEIMLSIDDLYERNTYVRHHSNWSDTLNTAQWLINLDYVHVSVCQTVSSLNVYHLAEFEEFWKDKVDYIAINFVTHPEHYNAQHLPMMAKLDCIDRIKNSSCYEQVRNFLSADGDAKHFKTFVEHTKRLDELRNQSFRDTYHDWSQILSLG